MERKSFGLTTQKLKIIACIAMLIDHMGLMLFNNAIWMRAVGRLAFPLFAFFIAEGCRYSKHPIKRLGTMASLGLVCALSYFAVLGKLDCNIFVTFSFSVCIIMAMDNAKRMLTDSASSVLNKTLSVLLVVALIPLVWRISALLYVEYGFAGAMVPVLVSLPDTHSMVDAPDALKKADNMISRLVMLSIGLLWLRMIYGKLSYFAFFVIPLLLLYNGKPGSGNLKWFFYIFYPAHVLALEGIRLLISSINNLR